MIYSNKKRPSSLEYFKDESQNASCYHPDLLILHNISLDKYGLSSIPWHCNGRTQYSLIHLYSVYSSKTGSTFFPWSFSPINSSLCFPEYLLSLFFALSQYIIRFNFCQTLYVFMISIIICNDRKTQNSSALTLILPDSAWIVSTAGTFSLCPLLDLFNDQIDLIYTNYISSINCSIESTLAAPISVDNPFFWISTLTTNISIYKNCRISGTYFSFSYHFLLFIKTIIPTIISTPTIIIVKIDP